MPAPLNALCSALSLLLMASAQAADYRLDLRPDFALRVLHGHARIRLDAADRLPGPLRVSSPGIEITRATLDGAEVPATRSADGWQVGPAGAPARVLEVDYLAPASVGLVFAADHVYTAFHTCRWMPCVSTDLERATVAIRLDLPAGHRSVASGSAVSVPADAGQQWTQTSSYPLYTFGFAAGRFDEVNEVDGSTRLRLLGAGIDEVGLRARFDGSPRVMDFLQDRAGLALPHPVYTQVLVPGDVAQEASGFALIGRRWLDPIVDDPQEDWVIVHEMAHQWWGNLITCARWNELWLNEGLAVYMTAAWKQHRWGEAAYRREMAIARGRWQRAREAGHDHPLNWAGDYPDLRTRRDIQYGKAAVFIQTLREQLGDAAFWAGLRRYTRDNAGRQVTPDDLRAAMEAGAGLDLKALFEQWVE